MGWPDLGPAWCSLTYRNMRLVTAGRETAAEKLGGGHGAACLRGREVG
jgi:hypothetical protein